MRTLKEQWVSALRSGEYEQGHRRLYTGGNFCCLGVFAEINGDLNKTTGRAKTNNSATNYGVDEGLIGAPELGRLIMMNDHGKTFSEIADYIEANVTVNEKAD